MSSILARVTRGKIIKNVTKTALVLAVAGSLYFSSPELISSGGGAKRTTHNIENIQREDAREFKRRIQSEDSDIIAIVEMCLKITTI